MDINCIDEKCKYYNHNVETHCLHFIQSCYKQHFKNGSIVEELKQYEKIIEDKKVDIDILTYDKALIIDFLKQLKDYISDFEYDVNRNSFINKKIDEFLIKL